MWIHWLGYSGTALVIVAYLPQITHQRLDSGGGPVEPGFTPPTSREPGSCASMISL